MQPELAFVLHTRPYGETSLLVDLFTRSYGRFRAVSRGSRGTKAKTIRLNAYSQILISWSGKSNLKTLTQVELSSAPLTLKGDGLFCGFYLNELLIRLLAENDPHQTVYDDYVNVLDRLASDTSIACSLRSFEISLLQELGYGINLSTDAESDEAIAPEKEYWFEPNVGFLLKQSHDSDRKLINLFKGEDLISFREGIFYSAPLSAKRLLRLALEPHIGEKPILSRNLFSKIKTPKSI